MEREEPAAARVLVLRWEISPWAVRVSPLAEIAAMNGEAERITRAALEWRIEDGAGAATLRLGMGEDQVMVDLGGAAGRWIESDGAEHGEFGALLRVSVIDGEVVYARTGLLAGVLGLRGGTYDGPLMPAGRS